MDLETACDKTNTQAHQYQGTGARNVGMSLGHILCFDKHMWQLFVRVLFLFVVSLASPSFVLWLVALLHDVVLLGLRAS